MNKTETKSTVLLKHHLKALKLPTMHTECEKIAARAKDFSSYVFSASSAVQKLFLGLKTLEPHQTSRSTCLPGIVRKVNVFGLPRGLRKFYQ